MKEHFKSELKTVEVPLKGWNWGDLEFTGMPLLLLFLRLHSSSCIMEYSFSLSLSSFISVREN